MDADSKPARRGGQARPHARIAAAALAAWLAAAGALRAAEPAAANDGPAYPVSRFVLLYAREHPEHPPLAPLLAMPIALGRTPKGYTAPQAGATAETIRLGDVRTGQTFFASAMRLIARQLVVGVNRRGLAGVFVAPHPEDIDTSTGQDKREASNTVLRLVVWTAVVSRVRTLAGGERLPADRRIDHPAHARVLDHSPLKPKDLLDKDRLERYALWLSRHPGRRVDAAVTSDTQPGAVALDYLITENRPWLAYAQASNTGTEATDKWRYRVGFIDNQLTGRDDILSVEYVTSRFREPAARAASASYEAPWGGRDRLRWRVYGSWGDFEAKVANGFFGEDFTGSEWRLGGELIATVCQWKQTFLDVFAGAAWWHVETDNQSVRVAGEADAFLPHLGARLERITDTATTLAGVEMEFNCPGIASSGAGELERLGRAEPDARWTTLRWDALQTFFLEPLLGRKGWLESIASERARLAHELAAHVRGQWAPGGERLIGQNERVVGGLFSVRGYPESIVAGDTAAIGTIEYRLHVPRLLKVQPDPARTPLPLVGTPFRWSAQSVFGRPDRDLIVRAFLDAGRTIQNGAMPYESNHTLLSVGLGVEVQFTRHFNVRCDLGIPLRSVATADETVQAGDGRLSFIATILY